MENILLLAALILFGVHFVLLNKRIDLTMKIGMRSSEEILKIYDHVMDLRVECIPDPEERKRWRNELEFIRRKLKASTV